MVKTPLVSVIIPAFNAALYIRETIDSVLQQTWQNLEVIVINDGSTDNTEQIVNEIGDQRVIYFYQHNAGSPKAKNFGVKKSKGKYVQFLDADDVISSDKIANQVRILENFPSSVVWCSTFKFETKEDILKCRNLEKIDPSYLYNVQIPLEFILKLNGFGAEIGMIQPNSYLISVKLLSKSGLWSEELSRSPDDDSEFFARIILNAHRIIYDDKSKNFYRRQSANSLSKKRDYEHALGAFKAIKLKFRFLMKYDNSEKIKSLYVRHLASCAYQFGLDQESLLVEIENEMNSIGRNRIPPAGGRYFKLLAMLTSFRTAMIVKKYIKRGFK